jgi:hypothetical protein
MYHIRGQIQKSKLINVLVIVFVVFEVKPDDSFLRVPFLAPVLLIALICIVTKFVTVVTLYIRLVLICSFEIGKGHRFRVGVYSRCRSLVIFIINQQIVGRSHTGWVVVATLSEIGFEIL